MSDTALQVLKDPPASSKQWDIRGDREINDHSVVASAKPSNLPHAEPSVFGLPRWYSTLNFVFSENTFPGDAPGAVSAGGGVGAVPSLWVDNLPSEEQEQLLLQELLYVLCGGEGSLITIQPVAPRGIAFLV